MFGLFDSPPFRDPVLGKLRRARGKWRGTIDPGVGKPVPLVLSGSRTAPDAEAVGIARSLPTAYPSWRPAIARGLFQHFEPYGEAESLPGMAAEADVWKHTTLAYVLVAPLAGALTVEIGLTVAWDEEHTLGARFRDGAFVELNGSVLPP